ncbi:MAG: DUF5711 family protein [Oscillospiraceae bacterium]
MEEKGDITKYSKKKASHKRAFRGALLLLVILSVILIVINWGKITAPLKDAALDLDEGGFPIQLAGSPDYVLNTMGDNLCLLTDMYITSYTLEGARISETQHGLQNPAMLTNNKRVLLYDISGKELGLYSRTGNLYKKTLDDTIVFCSLSNDERCAVVTTSARYVNTLYVFNGEGEQVFRYNSPLEKIMQTEFSDDGSELYVSTVSAKNGELSMKIVRFDLKKTESAVWEKYIGSSLTYTLEYCSDGLYVVTENGAMLLDTDTGEVLKSAGYGKAVTEILSTDKLRMTVFSDSASNGSVLTVYDKELNAAASAVVLGAIDIAAYGDRVYVLTATEVVEYDSALAEVKTTEISGVYSQLAVRGADIFLLGYNSIEKPGA